MTLGPRLMKRRSRLAAARDDRLDQFGLIIRGIEAALESEPVQERWIGRAVFDQDDPAMGDRDSPGLGGELEHLVRRHLDEATSRRRSWRMTARPPAARTLRTQGERSPSIETGSGPPVLADNERDRADQAGAVAGRLERDRIRGRWAQPKDEGPRPGYRTPGEIGPPVRVEEAVAVRVVQPERSRAYPGDGVLRGKPGVGPLWPMRAGGRAVMRDDRASSGTSRSTSISRRLSPGTRRAPDYTEGRRRAARRRAVTGLLATNIPTAATTSAIPGNTWRTKLPPVSPDIIIWPSPNCGSTQGPTALQTARQPSPTAPTRASAEPQIRTASETRTARAPGMRCQ